MRKPLRRRSALAGFAALVLLVSTFLLPEAYAVFSGTVKNTSTVTAAAAFPTTRQLTDTDAATIAHRLDEAPSAALTPTLADSAGTSEPGTAYGPTNGPALRWDLDEAAGATVTDRSGSANPGALGSGASWTTASRERTGALLLDGSADGYVAGAGPAVDTTKAFTISAWVYLTGSTVPSSNAWVGSQGGSQASAFGLGLSSGSWAFAMSAADAAAPAFDSAVSPAAAVTQTWTQLAAVFDPSQAGAQLRLYVNGALAATAAHTSTWSAGGAFQLGRLLAGGGWREPWPGRIESVLAYRRALPAAEVAGLYTDNPTGVFHLQENSGTTSRDGSGNGNTLTLSAAATWTALGHNGPALSFDGTANSFASGATTAVDTTASFSVMAWVFPTSTSGSGSRTAVSQDGNQLSGFFLQTKNNRWAFAMPGYDIAGTGTDAIVAPGTATPYAWTHLAGVFDSSAGTLTLYVNGVSQGSVSHTLTPNQTGRLRIGRAQYNAVPADFFIGRVDEVRIHRRVLSATEVANAMGPAPLSAGMPGALQGPQQGLTATTAMAFNGTTTIANSVAVTNPGPFTVECWFKTTSTLGGGIIAFQTSPSQTLPSTAGENFDRVLYMDAQGKLRFFAYPSGTTRTITSTAAYNDGAWHHLIAEIGPVGMRVYVDAAQAVTDATITTAQNFTGYWRWGGSSLGGYFTGSIDEIAVYPTELLAQPISWHYHANH
ncbi:LamG domain-containing protein [Paractinoplanes lichenicola]|uniref:LamG domain-containing protein n=1 Tax=Paractinoplanes lichenicola TaxID=2802976 RepID=A0ABS1VEX9_9ACTN|nr:LamG domain-containing protein [Actinoplanes lichenicola]MBL7253247.1 LamG domain-containing protein [Actinoplanes lichenicola]